MHRFYLPPERVTGSAPALTLTGREAHHAAQVLRIRRGGQVVVLDGAGNELLCEVGEVSRKTVALEIRQRRFIPAPPCRLTLIQAIPKGRTMEYIVQKATELGAARIVPVLTERVVVHLDDDSAKEKREKWRQVALEAIKQCGQPWLPEIATPLPIQEFLEQNNPVDLALVASLQRGSRHPREHFQSVVGGKNRNPESIAVWVGPEGDFTDREMTAIQAAGAQPITLGPHVLRADTAAIYCLSVLSYELQWV